MTQAPGPEGWSQTAGRKAADCCRSRWIGQTCGTPWAGFLAPKEQEGGQRETHPTPRCTTVRTQHRSDCGYRNVATLIPRQHIRKTRAKGERNGPARGHRVVSSTSVLAAFAGRHTNIPSKMCLNATQKEKEPPELRLRGCGEGADPCRCAWLSGPSFANVRKGQPLTEHRYSMDACQLDGHRKSGTGLDTAPHHHV